MRFTCNVNDVIRDVWGRQERKVQAGGPQCDMLKSKAEALLTSLLLLVIPRNIGNQVLELLLIFGGDLFAEIFGS